MNKVFSDEAWEDFEYWTKQDRKTLKRIIQFLQDIDRNGCIGRPPVQPGQRHKREPRAQPMAPPGDTATPPQQSINPLSIEMLRRSLVSFLPGRARVRHAALHITTYDLSLQSGK